LLGEDDECPSIRELEEVNEWLYAWLDLLNDPADLEQDVDLLKAVKGLILEAKQHIRLANGLPAEFSEKVKEVSKQRPNYIDVIYGAEMTELYAKIHLMESYESVEKSLSLCNTIIDQLDFLINDAEAILNQKERYAEYVCNIK
jgi:hypothetical protein